MAEYGKKLHVIKNGVEEEITLYDDKSEASENALCLLDGATPVYAALGDVTDSEASSLRVLYNGQTYSVLKEVASGGPLGLRLAAEGGGYGTWEYADLSGFDPVLNNNSWEKIQEAVNLGFAPFIWNVGDTKEVVLNGNTTSSNGTKSFNNYSCYATILGFDHNASLETNGEHSIHFILAKDSIGKDICFYPYEMNVYDNTSGGWNGSKMKQTTMTEFKNCLPTELRAVLKNVTKYTHNSTGGAGTSSNGNVTATTEQVFLLSEYEVFGSNRYASQYEVDKQAKYDYYKNVNSKVRYQDDDPTSAVRWWLRSASTSNSGAFCDVYSSGTSTAYYASSGSGVSPAFAI